MPFNCNYKTYLEIGLYIGLLFFVVPLKRHDYDDSDIKYFKRYLEDFNKSYPDEETFNYRLKAFKRSLETIDLLNKNGTKGSAKYGLTKFSDLLPEEFKSFHLNKPKAVNRTTKTANKNVSKRDTYWNSIPKQIDWRKNNTVTKIKTQKSCGACWAFAITETIETMQAIKTNDLKELSVQEMIDCSSYNNGCSGGDVCSLLRWIKDYNVSVVTESEYPLVLKDQKCRNTDTSGGVRIGDFSCDSLIGREDVILKLLAENGPVAVGINGETWQNYVGGVIQFHCSGEPSELNHAVQIIGYDLTAEIPYYIVRNSWGEDFGDNGYLYVAIGSNICGLAYEVSALTIL